MKKAVILFNLGGPDKLENVEAFLFNLFNDPAILNLPTILRFPLAKFIANRRTPTAKKIYEELGGSSPILKLTIEQSEKLEKKLKENKNYHVISNNKPKDYLPAKCIGFYENYKTTQLINWCDFIVSSRPSSVLLQGISEGKKILLLKYLYPKISKSFLVNSNKNIFLIENFKKMTLVLLKKKNLKISKIEKNNTLKKFLINYDKKNFKNLILGIYQ